ncbi:glycosyl hydrolase 108 family protein [Xanthobacter sp. V3C-3]|uniref:glycoside hydrolase family 108 protein n=1 Tax=Xanthobacter lutulentifluminis TaxID=3119935 RepID=UPI00372CE547
MVAANFKPSLACVNVHEGGKDDDKNDPGGRTAYGVTQARYNQYLRDKGRPRADVWSITVPEREEIWRTYYWNVVRADDLPAGLDYVVFDAAVNSGPAQAIRWLQRSLNDVRAKTGQGPISVDAQMGTNTIAAANAIDDTDAVIERMQARRLAMLQELRTWKYFGRGWGRRVAEVKKLGQAVARGSVPAPTPAGWVTSPDKAPIAAGGSPTSPKAFQSDAKPLPSATGGVVTTTIGTASSGVSTVTTAAQPAQGMSPTLDAVLQFLIVLGIVLTLAGAAWAWWANRKSKQMAEALDIAPPPALANDNHTDASEAAA